MKCLSCGFELDDDAVFCSQCGKKIELPVQDIAEAVTETVGEAADAVSEVKEAAKPVEAVEKAAEKAEEKVRAVAEDIKEDVAEAVVAEPVLPDTNATVAAIDEALEALNSQAEAAAETVTEDIKDKAEEKAAEVKEKAEETVEKLEDKAEEVKEAAAPKTIAPEIKPLKKREKPQYEAPADEAAPAAETAAPLYTQNEIGGAAPQYAQQQYAPYNEQYAAPQQPAQSEPEAPAKVGALRISFAGFIAILTIIFLTLVSLLFCVRIGCSGKVLENRTKNMNINTVLDADLGKRSLSDAIYNEVGFADASHDEVSKAEFRVYLSKTNLLQYAGSFVKDYADYFIEGDIADPSVTANEMADFFVNNDVVARTVLDCDLTNSDYNKIRTTLELKDTADNFSIDKWSKKAHFDLGNTSFIFSYVALGIILGLVLVLLVWIAVIVDGRGKHIVGMYGSVFSCSGGIVFAVGLAAVAGTAIANIITGWFIFYLLASLLLPFGVMALGIGAAELLLGFIFKRIRRGIKNSDKRNKAVEKALMGV